MPPANTLLTRVPNHFYKVITFDGTAGAGAVGNVVIASITGQVEFLSFEMYCVTSLAGAGATLAWGSVSRLSLAATTATDLDANEFFRETTPVAGHLSTAGPYSFSENMVFTVGTAAITAGVIRCFGYWRPLSPNGQAS